MAAVTCDFASEERTYRTKHGTVTTMNTANIGKAPRELPPLEPHVISDRLRSIKSALAVLPEPAVAAAQFPEDQRYFYPIADLRDMAGWLFAFADAMEKRMMSPHAHTG